MASSGSAEYLRHAMPQGTSSRTDGNGTPNHCDNRKKRKIQDSSLAEDDDVIWVCSTPVRTVSGSKKAKKGSPKNSEEKRLKVFRKKPPHTFLERLSRVRTQRMFLIDRTRSMSDDGTHPVETFDIAGTTGNIYQVTVSKVPKCTCPDAYKGNHCKHIVYVMVNILKAPENLSYQLAFLSTELNLIFAEAPSTPLHASSETKQNDNPGTRKPIEGECPICVMDFEDDEDVVWCRAACGNNIHRECFQKWATSKPGQVKCVYCRALWKQDGTSAGKIEKHKSKNEEGYVNVATELGLSGERDTSSYHQIWVRGRYGSRHGGYYDDYC